MITYLSKQSRNEVLRILSALENAPRKQSLWPVSYNVCHSPPRRSEQVFASHYSLLLAAVIQVNVFASMEQCFGHGKLTLVALYSITVKNFTHVISLNPHSKLSGALNKVGYYMRLSSASFS